MTMTKRISSLFICFMMMATFLGITPPVSAATSGGTGRTTINVTTKANYWYPGASSITLKQEKQTCTYKSLNGKKTKTKKGYYGHYTISIYNETKRKYEKSISWNDSKTKKIFLAPNCKYTITVSYDSSATKIFHNAPLGYSLKDISNPSWKVSSQWKVSSCY